VAGLALESATRPLVPQGAVEETVRIPAVCPENPENAATLRPLAVVPEPTAADLVPTAAFPELVCTTRYAAITPPTTQLPVVPLPRTAAPPADLDLVRPVILEHLARRAAYCGRRASHPRSLIDILELPESR
jgi:hypothetical protein